MSYPFRGNINGTVLSQSQNLPMMIENFSLVNKDAGAAIVNVYLLRGVNQICIMPLNKSISAGSNYESIRPTILLATEQIKVQSSAAIDYDFLISNTEATEVSV